MSQRPGSTLIPSVEITSAPSGIATSPTRPTALIRSPSISTTLFSSGRPPWPSISRPPTSALTEAAKAGPPPRVSNRRNVAIWRMGLLPPSGVDFVQELVEQMVEGLGAVHHQPVAGAGHQTGRQVGNQSVPAVGEAVHVADDRELRSLVALQGGERAGAEGAFQGADDGVLVSAPKMRPGPAPGAGGGAGGGGGWRGRSFPGRRRWRPRECAEDPPGSSAPRRGRHRGRAGGSRSRAR